MSVSHWLRGIKGKLFLSAILPVLGFGILTWVAYSNLTSVSGMLGESYTSVLPNVESLSAIEGGRARIGQYLWATISNRDSEKHHDNYLNKAVQALEEYKDAVKRYEAAPNLPGEEVIYAPMKSNYKDFVSRVEGFIEALKDKSPENYEKIRVTMTDGPYQVESIEIKSTVFKIMGMYSKLATENNILQVSETRKAMTMIFAIGLLCGLGVFSILMFIGLKLSKTVGGVAEQLSSAGSQVNLAIAQLSQAGQSLSQSSTSAAASLEETVASLEEMSSMVNMNSDNAKQAASLSHASRTAAEDGEREIKNLVTSMQEISQSSKKIEEIINVIDDIAFQTNLLALNAAVEAARAGEQGKGFAVVAEAVRALAQRSASSAKDISALIKTSVSQIEEGSKIADKSGEVLSNIVTSIKKVSDLNNEIAAASSEQTTGIQQISKAMNQLDQSSQSNAASSEEIASTAEEIASQSSQMQNLVGTLNKVVTGAEEMSSEHPLQAEAVKEPAPTAKSSAKKSSPVSAKPAAKVIKFQAPPKKEAPKKSAEMIPFDEDETRKVGTTDGF